MGKTGRKPVTLSICMMVKDEEDNLKRCLPSLQNVADELIVVDTGSSDNTIKVAESFGAKVFHHTWEDDFSKHRNQTIEHASGDWVFIIDADEELFFTKPTSASSLKTWLAKIPEDCMSVAIILKDIQQNYVAMSFNSVRLFRRGAVRYDGIVHNMPVIIKGKPEAVFYPEVYLKHYGYDLNPELQAKKRVRTEGLLLKRIEQNPDDVVAYFYLVQSYAAYGEIEKAAQNLEKYKEVSTRTDTKFNGSIFCTAFHVYRKLGNKAKAKEWLLQGLTEYPEDLDLLMALTEFGVWTTDINLLSKGARGFLHTYKVHQTNPIASGNRFTYSNTPEALSYCLFHLSMATFQEGCVLLDQLKETLNKVSSEFSDGMTKDVHSVFSQFGIVKDNWGEISEPLRKVVNL
jgi:glycosyltransferase involved in cell wall biosynthesis